MRTIADGKVIISTDLDNSGLEKGAQRMVRSARSQAASLAAIYRKQGMSQSEAMKTAWSEIERTSQDSSGKAGKSIVSNIGGATTNVVGSLGGLTKVLLGITASIATAFATATVSITKQSVEAYADYEQLTGGVETLFKDSAAKVISYAEDAFYTTNLSANEYMETVTGFTASLIGSLKGDTEKAADVANMALVDMADNANKMGSTMESIKNAYQGFAKQNYTMLDNLKLGYGGTRTEMERLLRDAEAFSGVKYNINNLSDVYNAIHAIQEKLEIAGATADEAERTITGSANMTKAAWKNVLTALAGGGDLKKAMNNLVFSISKYFKNIVPVVQTALSGIGQLIEEVAPALVESVASALIASLPNLLNAVYQMIVGLAKGIYQGIVALFTGNGVTSDVEKQLNGVASSAGAAAESEKELAEGIEASGKAAKKTLAGFDELRILQEQSGGGSGAGSVSLPGVSGGVGSKKENAESAEETISWLDAVAESFKPIKEGFEEAFTADIPKLKRNWERLTTTMKNTFSDPSITSAVERFSKSANEALGSVAGSVSGIATSLTSGVVGGVADAQERLEEFNRIKLESILKNLASASGSVKEISKGASEIATAFEEDGFQGIVEFLTLVGDQTVMDGLDRISGFFSDKLAMATKPIADNSKKIADMLDKVFQIGDLLLEPAKELMDKIAENTIAYEDSLIHQFFQEATEFSSAGLGKVLDKINEGLDGLIDLISGKIDFTQWFEEYVEPAFSVERWEGLMENAQQGFTIEWEEIERWWESTAIAGLWNDVIAPWFTVEKWAGLLKNAQRGWESEWNNIHQWWNTSALGTLWQQVTDFFDSKKWRSGLSGLTEGFGGAFKDAANEAIAVLNQMISWINQRLYFTIPELNVMGKQLWPTKYVTLANIPSIPHLAKGAVLPANKPFMAVVGDQKHGTNVEAPLSTIQEAVAVVMQDMVASNMAGHEATVAVLQEILEALLGIQIGDEVIASAVDRYRTKMAVVKGG